MLDAPLSRFMQTTDADHGVAVEHLWRRLWERGDIYLGTHSGWYCVSDETFYAEHQVEDVPGSAGKTSKETGKPVHWVSERNYLFRLSRYRERVIEWLGTGPVVPAGRVNDLRGYLSDPDQFQDISVSRKASVARWGIPVPGDSSQIIYVWLDALANYLTATGYPHTTRTPDLHVVGKDILKCAGCGLAERP